MSTTKPPGIQAPPLTLGDDADDDINVPASALFDGLRNHARTPLGTQDRAALRQTAETSPLVTTRSHRPPSQAHEKPPEPPAPPPEKVIRDGYSIPRGDHEHLERLAILAMRSGHNIGKSGILRLGVRVLAAMPEDQLLDLVRALPAVPTAKRKR